MKVAELVERIVVTELVRPPAPSPSGWGVYVYQHEDDVGRDNPEFPPMLVFRAEDDQVVRRVCATVRHMVTLSMKSVHEVREGERTLVRNVLTRRKGTRFQLAADLMLSELNDIWARRVTLITPTKEEPTHDDGTTKGLHAEARPIGDVLADGEGAATDSAEGGSPADGEGGVRDSEGGGPPASEGAGS